MINNKCSLKILICSDEHYYHETNLRIYLKDNPSIQKVMVTRCSTENLSDCNTIFINPYFYHTFQDTAEFIQSVRTRYPYIIFVLCGNKEDIHSFITAVGKKYEHYFQFPCEVNDTIDKMVLDPVINNCITSIEMFFENKYEYDVALSFAGEDRAYVEEVAVYLKNKKVRVFYDNFEMANLFGKNLYTYLSEVYSKKSRYVILFISKYYYEKHWTNHEINSMQARAFTEKSEYILPARFDDTEIPGLLNTIGYIDLRVFTPIKFAKLVVEKIQHNI